MIVFLVIVSLTLNILAFFVIAILFMRQDKLIKLEENLKKPMVEIEEIISSYLLQMKEENDEFIHQLTVLKENDGKSQPSNSSENKEIQYEQSNSVLGNHDSIDLENYAPRIAKTLSHHAVNAYQKQNLTLSKHSKKSLEINNSNEQQSKKITTSETLGEQIVLLTRQGFSIEDIAKKLKKGKTEVELLLKFQENILE